MRLVIAAKVCSTHQRDYNKNRIYFNILCNGYSRSNVVSCRSGFFIVGHHYRHKAEPVRG
jgi:hypothetical protein